jgi:hypothetical protein
MRELYLTMAQSSDYGMKDEFDLWLEGELDKGYVPFSATPPPTGAPYRAGVHAAGRHGLPRGRAARAAIVAATVAIGLMGTTAFAATAVTGSANPQVWGQYVNDAVSTCKSELGSGEHNIGRCVSAIARQKGTQERNQHSIGHGASQNHPGQGGPSSGVPSGPPSGRP